MYMPSVGDLVYIRSGSEYSGQFCGQFGKVKNLAGNSSKGYKVGVEIKDAYNVNSSKGLFWFSSDHIVKAEFPYIDPPSPSKCNVTITVPARRSFVTIKQVIYSGPKTIILWEDGSKTIVSCGEKDTYDHYAGFCAAITKKVFGSTSAAKKILGRTIKKEDKNNEKV